MGAWGAAAAGDNDGYVGLKVAGVLFNTCGVDEGDPAEETRLQQGSGRAGPGCAEQRAGGRAGGGAGPRSPCLAASFFVFGNSEWEWRVPPSKEGAVTQDPLGSGMWPLRGTRCSPAGPG